jgi:hypothetical protein
MTARETENYLKTSNRSLLRMEKDGLPFHRLTPKGPKRYYRHEVDTWLRSKWSSRGGRS